LLKQYVYYKVMVSTLSVLVTAKEASGDAAGPVVTLPVVENWEP
jgi:hypothetical protein